MAAPGLCRASLSWEAGDDTHLRHASHERHAPLSLQRNIRGPTLTFVRLVPDASRVQSAVERLARLWTEKLRSGQVDVRFYAASPQQIVAVVDDAETALLLRDFLLAEPLVYEWEVEASGRVCAGRVGLLSRKSPPWQRPIRRPLTLVALHLTQGGLLAHCSGRSSVVWRTRCRTRSWTRWRTGCARQNGPLKCGTTRGAGRNGGQWGQGTRSPICDGNGR